MKIDHVKKGDRDFYTYSKDGMSFSLDEYIELLKSFLKRENVKFRHISYTYEDKYDYTEMDTIEDINDIEKLYDNYPVEATAFFVDNEKSYRLSYSLYYKDKIELASCDISLLEEALKKR